jgi:hypothetical protein
VNFTRLSFPRYDFTDGDLSVSLAQMREFLEEYKEQVG